MLEGGTATPDARLFRLRLAEAIARSPKLRHPPGAARRTACYIVSWVPPAFLDRAEAGRRDNPLACIHGADELPAFRPADYI